MEKKDLHKMKKKIKWAENENLHFYSYYDYTQSCMIHLYIPLKDIFYQMYRAYYI